MSLDGRYVAVLDRVEDGVGVLLVEEDGDVIEEVHVDPGALPDAAGEGAVLEAAFEGGALQELVYRPDETAERRRDVQSRFDALAERPPGSDDAEEDE